MDMGLQDFYDSLIRVARLNPSIMMQGNQFDDPCHSVDETEPPLCFSPQDLSDPTARSIEFDDGEIKQILGPMELLEAYRQLIVLDASDGKLDGKLSNPILSLPDVRLKKATALRYYGPHWTPDVRLRHYLKWYEGELGKQLPSPHPELENARTAVQWEYNSALKMPYPLMAEEKRFITEAASQLQQRGYEYAGNLVFDMIGKARAIVLGKNSVWDADLAKALYFLQEDRNGKVAVFFTTSADKDGKRIAFNAREEGALRGLVGRTISLNRLNTYLKGRKVNEGEYSHVESVLRDFYIYGYLSYETKTGRVVSLGYKNEVYFRIVVLHEAFHTAALLEANSHQPGHPLEQPFDWEKLAEPLKVRPPEYKETESFVQYLANLLRLQRAAFDVQIQFDRKSEVGSLTPEQQSQRKMVERLRDLASEATEYLTDVAAWEMTVAGVIRGSQGSIREKILNPNEESVLTKILQQ